MMVFLGPIIAAIKELLEPITQVPKVGAPAEAFSWWQQTLEAANAVARVVLQNPWLAGVVFGGLVLAWLGHTIKKNRVAKAAAGACTRCVPRPRMRLWPPAPSSPRRWSA